MLLNHLRSRCASVCLLAVVCAALLGATRTAKACVTTTFPELGVNIAFIAPGTAAITVVGYELFGAGSGQFCACAFKELGFVTSVNDVEVRDGQTNAVLAAFAFNQNAGTSASAGGLSPGEWQGFLASISQTIPAGGAVNLRFEVAVEAGTTLAQMANEIDAAGPLVITGEGNADGSFAGMHQSIVSAATIVGVPTVSEWGLIILALLLLSGGTIAVRRMTAARPAIA